MKTTLLLAAALAGLALLAPGVTSTPAACADPCVIPSHTFAFVLPVAEIASGGSVVWESLDTAHANADGTTIADPCFFVTYNAAEDSPPVRFDATDGGLVATDTDGRSKVCETATALPAGGYVLPYYCVLHTMMRGELVVTTV